ncbi:uncharacterized protein FMAN_11938 [Fusarium mangiferae]|uniref:Uncharacterized protein n=1 Tax=Fusarium mangiferae TaxID=192010 RepID=A0A1L7U801_FUSMA|nr:uncharacterized protein FMAN_11938 [Fusarium mangiferae]CVL06844.1 uncharacterized protein FMAN_11938 [Fusarium mangiferae]
MKTVQRELLPLSIILILVFIILFFLSFCITLLKYIRLLLDLFFTAVYYCIIPVGGIALLFYLFRLKILGLQNVLFAGISHCAFGISYRAFGHASLEVSLLSDGTFRQRVLQGVLLVALVFLAPSDQGGVAATFWSEDLNHDAG